ncbi:MAG: hypothetical protein DHS20C10_06780 [marine bacterium B5-7]|nr:MAG: hypothetical protein DHS20C10_06780 [marine bacterium B5-7]
MAKQTTPQEQTNQALDAAQVAISAEITRLVKEASPLLTEALESFYDTASANNTIDNLRATAQKHQSDTETSAGTDEEISFHVISRDIAIDFIAHTETLKNFRPETTLDEGNLIAVVAALSNIAHFDLSETFRDIKKTEDKNLRKEHLDFTQNFSRHIPGLAMHLQFLSNDDAAVVLEQLVTYCCKITLLRDLNEQCSDLFKNSTLITATNIEQLVKKFKQSLENVSNPTDSSSLVVSSSPEWAEWVQQLVAKIAEILTNGFSRRFAFFSRQPTLEAHCVEQCAEQLSAVLPALRQTVTAET